MAANKYDWNVDAGLSELGLEIETTWSWKSYIDDQAIGAMGRLNWVERRGRRKSIVLYPTERSRNSIESRIAASSSMTATVGIAVE